MKKQHRLLLCLVIVIVSILAQSIAFAATPEVASTTSETAVGEDLPIVADGDSSFVFITPKNGPSEVSSAAKTVQSAVKDATGVMLEIQHDGKTGIATEILVGATSREESKVLMEETPYGEYAIRVINGKIVIAAWDDQSITKACEDFAAYVKEQGKKGEVTVAGDYSAAAVVVKGFGAIPHYGSIKTKVQFIDLADNSYMLYVKSTSKSVFNNYLDSLTEQGFTEFSHRTAGTKMIFAVYKNEDTILHISFNASTAETRIVAEKAYDMTIFTEQAYEKVCEPTVTMVGQEFFIKDNSKQAPLSNGLCLVFRLEDGRFIIVDGGYHEASVNMLYKTLRKLHVNEGKITIAAWILTHPHSDHTGAFTMLSGTTIKNRIVVENFIHHFASADQHRAIKDAGTSSATRTAMKGYSGANIIKAHSGQVIKAGGVEIEMLFTYADMEPAIIDRINTESLVFRVTVQDNSIMVLADAESRTINHIYKAYGDYLKSDMVQLAHHGMNGGAVLYQTIDADVVLWPIAVDSSYNQGVELIRDVEFNKVATDLAEEVYVAGNAVFTLPLPYTPADNASAVFYLGGK